MSDRELTAARTKNTSSESSFRFNSRPRSRPGRGASINATCTTTVIHEMPSDHRDTSSSGKRPVPTKVDRRNSADDRISPAGFHQSAEKLLINTEYKPELSHQILAKLAAAK